MLSRRIIHAPTHDHSLLAESNDSKMKEVEDSKTGFRWDAKVVLAKQEATLGSADVYSTEKDVASVA